MNTETYYAALRQQRETLTNAHPSGYLLVMSVDNLAMNSRAGNVCEVSVKDAARLLMDGSHRVATPDEVNAYQNRQGVERSRISRDDLDRVREQFKGIMGGTRA